MVNEAQGKEYSPRPVYNRKLLRTVIRNQAAKKNRGHVSGLVHNAFEQVKAKRKESVNV